MADKGMKKRWISLYVENQVGVLSKISGLFSGKSYNLDSLTVGTTEDPTVSRMTIGTVSDDETFEQIKKQLNRMVEVIKVIDFTNMFVRMKEILYIKVFNCSSEDKVELLCGFILLSSKITGISTREPIMFLVALKVRGPTASPPSLCATKAIPQIVAVKRRISEFFNGICCFFIMDYPLVKFTKMPSFNRRGIIV